MDNDLHPWLEMFDKLPADKKQAILVERIMILETNLGTATVLLLINLAFTLVVIFGLMIIPIAPSGNIDGQKAGSFISKFLK